MKLKKIRDTFCDFVLLYSAITGIVFFLFLINDSYFKINFINVFARIFTEIYFGFIGITLVLTALGMLSCDCYEGFKELIGG